MKPTVLFVDDEDIILQSLKNQLRPELSETCTLEFTTHVDEALEILNECNLLNIPSIVVSDWMIQGVSGAQFLRDIHSNYPNSKKVVLTGQASQDEMKALMLEVDIERAIRKPWDREDLVVLINKMVHTENIRQKVYVLCVDDEETILRSLKAQLKQFFGTDFMIETAASGQEALDLLEELKKENNLPHLIISDQIMPAMSGDELLAKVKENYPQMVRILLTGQANQDNIIKAINNAGLYRFLSKPWNVEDLNLTVKSGLESYDAENRVKAERQRMLDLYLDLEDKVSERTEKIKNQQELIAKQELSLKQSVNYAKKIQDAILPPLSTINDFFADSFVFFQPKEIVSGDFYLFWKLGADQALIATLDCTGHGVSGAFLTIISKFMMDIVTANDDSVEIMPDEILYEVNQMIVDYLTHENPDKEALVDGFDVALCKIDYKNQLMYFTGANHSLLFMNEGKLSELRGNRRSIGFTPKGIAPKSEEFHLHISNFKKGDRIYMFSDGLIDQFGGSTSKKYTKKRVIELLKKEQAKPLKTQLDLLIADVEKWHGTNDQTDDITLIGLEL